MPEGIDRKLLTFAGVVVLGAVMSILDTTVVNVAINTLGQEFDAELTSIQWVVTGYTLALATVIPLTGWGADRFGTKRIYVTSVALFTLGSALCGLAWSEESLIVFRVLQGFGGGMIMPAGMTILTHAAGPDRVGRVMSIIGVPMLIGPIAGPILGGWLVDDVSWRWIFFINVPIGIVAFALAMRVLPRDTSQPQHRLDALGLVLLSPALAAMIYGLAETNSAGGFGAAKVLIPLVGGAGLLATFIWHALRASEPLIDLRLFANRTFAAAAATFLLFSISVFGGLLLLPLYLQVVRGESVLHSGLLTAPQGLGAMITMPIAGVITDRIGPGRVVLAGLATVLLATVGLTQLEADTSYWLLGADLFLFGLGMGASMMPTMSAAMQTLRRAAVARATTTLNILRQVGASVGTAVLSVLLTHALTDRVPQAEGGLDSLGAVPAEARDRVAPAMAEAFGATFWWAAGLVVLALLSALLLPRMKPAADREEDTEPALPV
jgi:EmrB/QacA subfamily drug resistance transporter